MLRPFLWIHGHLSYYGVLKSNKPSKQKRLIHFLSTFHRKGSTKSKQAFMHYGRFFVCGHKKNVHERPSNKPSKQKRLIHFLSYWYMVYGIWYVVYGMKMAFTVYLHMFRVRRTRAAYNVVHLFLIPYTNKIRCGIHSFIHLSIYIPHT